ncbi:helix-turn-helix transcriptional regulator [Paenibacillus filicis]|uniref:Helix-turn-helix transcriptional regulator n=1 Tax=Paenibacillus filicis TaxID=669464 RepID=A0ABU9DRC3_9BACL
MILVKKNFSERLKELRAEKGLTQDQVAEFLDIPHSNIRRYESEPKGIPRRQRLELMADFFGVSIDYLIGRTDERNKTISQGANDLLDAIDLSKEDAIKKIKTTFSFNGDRLTEDQAKTAYYLLLGVLKEK